MGLGDWLRDRAGKLVEARLGSEFRERTQALAVRQNEYGYDPFGFSTGSLRVAWVLADFLYNRYFRCEAHGLEHVPAGRVLIVGNHSGQLPFDAMVIASA